MEVHLSSTAAKQIPRGLKPARNDKNEGLYGAAKAAPFQNVAQSEFVHSLLSVPDTNRRGNKFLDVCARIH